MCNRGCARLLRYYLSEEGLLRQYLLEEWLLGPYLREDYFYLHRFFFLSLLPSLTGRPGNVVSPRKNLVHRNP